MDVVRSLADRIIVLHNGKLVADGKPAEVIASPIVQEAYLGSRRRQVPHERRCSRFPACIPISGAITSCTASISPCRGADHDAARPQRRRQDHDAAHHHGPVAGLGRRDPLDGRASRRTPTPDIARLGIGYVPESMAVFSDLTVKENLVLAARDGPLDERAWNGSSASSRRCRSSGCPAPATLSGGQKQMLSIARAIVEPRKLLLIDEPTKGLAPAIIVALIECFARDQAPRRHDPRWSSRISMSRGRSAMPWW